MKIVMPVVMLDAMLISSNVAETSPAGDEWDSSTLYNEGDEVTVTHTGGGASVATHLVYTCNDAHSGRDPTTGEFTGDGLGWTITDATNRWRAFNGVLQQEVTNADTIEYEIKPAAVSAQVFNSAVFFGVDAQSIQVTVTDPTDGVVYDETFEMISDSGITDWYAYFNEAIIRQDRLVITDLPAYPSATLDIIVDDTGNTPELGEVVFGTSFVLGDSQNGASFGIIDYSVKNTDANGNITINQGAYADIADINVIIKTSRFDHINKTLKGLRSTPTVWIASDQYDETIVYGFFRNFRNVISGPVVSTTLLQLEGLT